MLGIMTGVYWCQRGGIKIGKMTGVCWCVSCNAQKTCFEPYIVLSEHGRT